MATPAINAPKGDSDDEHSSYLSFCTGAGGRSADGRVAARRRAARPEPLCAGCPVRHPLRGPARVLTGMAGCGHTKQRGGTPAIRSLHAQVEHSWLSSPVFVSALQKDPSPNVSRRAVIASRAPASRSLPKTPSSSKHHYDPEFLVHSRDSLVLGADLVPDLLADGLGGTVPRVRSLDICQGPPHHYSGEGVGKGCSAVAPAVQP